MRKPKGLASISLGGVFPYAPMWLGNIASSGSDIVPLSVVFCSDTEPDPRGNKCLWAGRWEALVL